MAIKKPSTNDIIVLGSGYVFFDLEDSDGNLTGERYLGQTPGFTLNVTTPNQVDVYSSDGQVEELLRSFASRVDRQSSINVRNMSRGNLALFTVGTEADETTGAGSVTDESHTVQLDRWYQLGQDATHPAGVRDITNVVVTDSGGTTTYVEDTDYQIDLELGRLYIMSGGSISDDEELLVDYDTQVSTWDQISSANLAEQYGALRYVADDQGDAQRDLYAPRVLLIPNGEVQWKSRDTVQQLAFSARYLRREVAGTKREAVYINGRAV